MVKKNGSGQEWGRRQWGVILGGIVLMVVIGFGVGARELAKKESRVLGVSTSLSTQEIISLLNLERAKQGLGPVSENEKLMMAARNKGEDMLTLDYWAHVSPKGMEPWTFLQKEDYNYQSAGENLARDFKSETDLLAAWMASPTHRANILNGNYSETGLAVLDGIIEGKPVVLVVNFFAQPRGYWGLAPKTAVYDQEIDSVILSGEINTNTQQEEQKRLMTRGKQVVMGAVVVAGVGVVLMQLKRKPYGARKRKRR
jgi:hypothetical protein